jgi:hypothetical protein
MQPIAASWLSRSFEEHTVAWVVISSLVGGVIGGAVKFTFEDVLRPVLGWRRDAKQVVRRYATPLVRSAEALERRINILVRNHEREWFVKDEYFRLSTLYAFGEHLGWIRIVERRFGFLPFESSRRGAVFNRRLNGIFRGLTSHAYFRTADTDAVDASTVPRLMLTAIGEVMTTEDGERVIEFNDFARRYSKDAQFRRWFGDLVGFLEKARPLDPLRWDRLLLTAANLRALARFLDPKGRLVGRRPAVNLDLLSNSEVLSQLRKDFPHLIPKLRPPEQVAEPLD